MASLEPGDIHDVYTVRRTIEVGAIPGGGSPEALAAVRAPMEEGKIAAAADDDEGLGTANQHFHGAIVALAGNGELERAAELLLAYLDRSEAKQAEIHGE
ncbi:DNA-binding GntR family transcriptional regulator [Arthrobacter sp. PvP023]|nr:DNA-binding GntR family transcriptional regulator [Arthrobacter sp. PvP023]